MEMNILPEGLYCCTEQYHLWILPVDSCILRIVYSLNPRISARESLSVTVRARTFADWSVLCENGIPVLKTKQLSAYCDPDTLAVTVYDAQGKLLIKETPGEKFLDPTPLLKTRAGSQEDVEMTVTADGLRMKNNNLESYLDRQSYHGKISFLWQEGEALYGLGSHEEGIMNLRGTNQYLYQQNMKACVPVLVSNRMYALLFDNYSFMSFRDDQYGSYIWMEYGDELDYYVISGDSPEAITRGYYQLTGRPPLLPKWAFGYIQSKERYVDGEELISVAAEYRRRKIPLDCIVLDWQSWEGDLWGEKIFDEKRFPNPAKMVEDLHKLDVKLMISIWPNMAPGGKNLAEMEEKGFVLANHSTYNAFLPEARELYWKHASEGLFSSGLDAWWCDCTEPFEGDWKGDVKPEPEARIALNCNEARTYLDPAYINAYSLRHSEGIYQGQRQETSEKRVVNLTRSSYSGQHRYGTITWSGDTAASWDTLQKQIPAGLNFCVTGEPYWSMDIGAFFVKRQKQWFWAGQYQGGCADMAYRELYLRWLQYGVFVPMFRSHGTDTPREVWQFGQPGEIIYDSIVKFIRLRYRLLPYIYSLAGQVHFTGGAMMRPLGMDFPHDPFVADIKTQYMFGPSLLICPVTEPFFYQNQKPATMEVYLPEGSCWYDFWTGKRYAGGLQVRSEVRLDQIPIFIRGGAVIPMAQGEPSFAQEIDPASLDVLVCPSEDGTFLLYEDAGDGYGYEAGQRAFTRFIWNSQKQQLATEIEGSFEGLVADKNIRIIFPGGAI